MERSSSPVEEVFRSLERLRTRLRLLSFFVGCARLLVAMLLFFWLSFLLDFLFEPNHTLRICIAGVLAVAIFFVFYRYLASGVFARLSLVSVALAVERRFPQFNDSLLTTVELARQSHGFSEELVAQSTRHAADQLQKTRINRLLRWKPLFLSLLMGLLLAGTVGTFCYTRPVLADFWYRRAVLLEDLRYPRRTHLSIVGFDSTTKKVARGRDFELFVEATGVIPERVSLRYHLTASGNRGSVLLVKVGTNRFRHQWRNLLEPVEFTARGGDDQTPLHTLVTVEPPRITQVQTVATAPKYTGIPERTHTVAGGPITVAAGTRLQFSAEANKPLRWLQAQVRGNNTGDAQVLSVDKRCCFPFAAEQSSLLELTLEDEDGIQLLVPFPIDVIAVADLPPKVEAVLDGVRQQITTNATVPLLLSVSDDYGVAGLEFAYRIDPAPEASSLPIVFPDGSIPQRVAFAVETLKLPVGGKIALAVVATDGNNLQGPNRGRSADFRFEIVSDEQLLANIANAELNLRQRFEQVIRELEESSRELTRLLSLSQNDSQELTQLSAERLIQDVRKGQTETAAVTRGFREVVAEMRNNRVGTSAMFERLEQGVLQPLGDIEELHFSESIGHMVLVRQAVGQSELPDKIAAAEQSMDRLLRQCRLALEAMRKLESFNEAIAMLRGILDAQSQLLDDTKTQRKKTVLDLLK